MSDLERALVHVTTWVMAITGAAYFYMKYVMSGSDPFSIIHHPWQPHALSLHVLGGPAAVFALGLIARDHILDRIFEPRQRRGRATASVSSYPQLCDALAPPPEPPPATRLKEAT